MKQIIFAALAVFAALVFSCKTAPVAVEEAKAENVVVEDVVVTLGGVPNTLSFNYTPEYFSPDGDGDNDELTMKLGVSGASAVDSWTVVIRQPESFRRQGQEGSLAAFKTFTGKGAPPAALKWDGKGDAVTTRSGGEFTPTVMSATDYPLEFTVSDAEGSASEPLKALISVDVLVIPQSDGRLRIQVSSIIFRAGAADFEGLDARIVGGNRRTIARIASILNKFPDYKVRIEGHANPENAPGTEERAKEDIEEGGSGAVSAKRAGAIADRLAEDGVDAARITTVGIGTAAPVVDFEDKDNVARNRRVEFYLEKK